MHSDLNFDVPAIARIDEPMVLFIALNPHHQFVFSWRDAVESEFARRVNRNRWQESAGSPDI